MEQIISGVAKFQREVFPEREADFKKLANGQSPEVLFITCSDSRVDPSMVTQAQPGDLFICRNAGNVVPPRSNQTGGMTASIEFAVAALGVSHIVVCGHTDCGAIKGAIAPEKLGDMPHVREWLGHCSAATAVVKERHGEVCAEHLDELTQENVLLQLAHLRTHPSVAAKLASGRISLHGWVYNIGSGEVLCYNEQSDRFEVMDQRYSTLLAQGDAV